MKIVTPSWLVESARAGVLLPWRDFIFKTGDRIEAAQGRQVAQRSILDAVSTYPKTESFTRNNIDVLNDRISSGIIPSDPTQNHYDPQKLKNAQPKASLIPPNVLPGASPAAPHGPIFTNDPITRSVAARVPGYAADTSNINATKAMLSEDWRVAHTSAAGADFIDGYYKNSRLHHLSMWKAELKELVKEALLKCQMSLYRRSRRLSSSYRYYDKMSCSSTSALPITPHSHNELELPSELRDWSMAAQI